MSATDLEILYPTFELNRCPHAAFAKLRDEAPVYQLRWPHAERPEFFVTRYEDAREVVMREDIFANATYTKGPDGERQLLTPDDVTNRDQTNLSEIVSLQGNDPPAHTWKRELLVPYFRPRLVDKYEPIILSEINRLIDAFVADGRVEFVSQFARPFAAHVTMLVVGLPVEDAHLAARWGLYEGHAMPYHTPEDRRMQEEVLVEIHEYVEHALRDRVANPRDDILTGFVQSHLERNEAEVGLAHARFDLISALLGGTGTLGHATGNTMEKLVREPEKMAQARRDPAARELAFEEAIRLESPIQWNVRMAMCDTELGGTHIPAGSLVLVSFAAANRDERHFEDPDMFDLERKNSRQHLAFGHGRHFCPGAPLGRLAVGHAFSILFERLDNIQLDGPEDEAIKPHRSLAMRGLQHLKLTFTPES